MLDYFKAKKSKKEVKEKTPAETDDDVPILNQEDEAFLYQMTLEAEGPPPPLPERRPALPPRPKPQDLPVTGEADGNNAQLVLLDVAKNIPVPSAPETPNEPTTITDYEVEEPEEIDEAKQTKQTKAKHKSPKKPTKWSFLRRDSRDAKKKSQKATAEDLSSAAEGLKASDAQPNEDSQVSDEEASKEEEEMTNVLEQLNLAAVDNRVFSMSKESKELLHKFTLVLKDIVNGVPTAYGDLESLLTNSEGQMQQMFDKLPPFLQKLVKQLPGKLQEEIGPEMLAAAAEKQGIHSKHVNKAASVAEKAGMRIKTPNLKDLITKPGAVMGLLKAIMNFLKLRFPAFLGMNVLYSLGLFILLFVFWYCHKRGRETRLEKDRLLTEAEIEKFDRDDRPITGTAPTTNAPQGAPLEDVEASMHVKDSSGQSQYAPGGSLAKETARTAEE